MLGKAERVEGRHLEGVVKAETLTRLSHNRSVPKTVQSAVCSDAILMVDVLFDRQWIVRRLKLFFIVGGRRKD